MQHSPPEIKDKLLKALDSEYNVVDMGAVLEIITILEKTPITKEALESTRLGKHINEFRRKTDNESLAKRAKDLVRRWRDMIMPTAVTTPPSAPSELPAAVNGSSGGGVTGPGPGGTGRICRSALTSPAMSTASSSSPGLSVRKGPSLPTSPLPPSRVAHAPNSEAVARTHANNKRLRKDDSTVHQNDGSPPSKRRATPNGVYSKDYGEDSAQSASLVPIIDQLGKNVKSSSNISSCIQSGNTSQMLVSNDNDIVKAKMAQIGRSAKVKTTQELLDDMKARGGSPPPTSSKEVDTASRHRALNFLLAPRSPDEVSKSKTEHMAKFLSSTADSPSPCGSPTTRQVAEIMSSLPPLDLSAIHWSDDEEESSAEQPKPEQPVPSELVEPVLSGENVEAVTGTTGCVQTDNGIRTEFREWHEHVWRESYDQQLLLVWPYVIID